MQPKELYAKWLGMVPAKRIAEAAELKSVSSSVSFLALIKDLSHSRLTCFWRATHAVI